MNSDERTIQLVIEYDPHPPFEQRLEEQGFSLAHRAAAADYPRHVRLTPL